MNKEIMMLMVFILLAAFIAMPAYGQAQSADTMDESAMQTGQQAGTQGVVRASEMMGVKVQDQQGNSVGTVADLILTDQGNIEYLVLAQGGMFGFGNKMVPIPWEKVSTEEPDTLKLAVDQQKLKEAPSFSKSDWEQMSAGDFEQQVRGYYGVEKQPANAPYQPEMKKREGYGTEQQEQ